MVEKYKSDDGKNEVRQSISEMVGRLFGETERRQYETDLQDRTIQNKKPSFVGSVEEATKILENAAKSKHQDKRGIIIIGR